MNDDVVEKTRKTAALYFEGVQDEGPYALWKAFDRDLAKDLSLFKDKVLNERLGHQYSEEILAVYEMGEEVEARLNEKGQ